MLPQLLSAPDEVVPSAETASARFASVSAFLVAVADVCVEVMVWLEWLVVTLWLEWLVVVYLEWVEVVWLEWPLVVRLERLVVRLERLVVVRLERLVVEAPPSYRIISAGSMVGGSRARVAPRSVRNSSHIVALSVVETIWTKGVLLELFFVGSQSP